MEKSFKEAIKQIADDNPDMKAGLKEKYPEAFKPEPVIWKEGLRLDYNSIGVPLWIGGSLAPEGVGLSRCLMTRKKEYRIDLGETELYQYITVTPVEQ